MKSSFNFSRALLDWFAAHGRKDLPWQHNPTPYRVWVSEIMLQQTQVATVIPYYQRFMEQLPCVDTLAAAEEDHVLHLWTGLGYYARARNLHKCAKIIANDFLSKFPDDLDGLVSLPGIGRSTAGAILALAFNKQATILDGNVKRVLARFFMVEGWTGQTKVQQQLWEHAENLTPRKDIAAYTQAIMDLGATLCTRSSPKCSACPMNTQCAAYREQKVKLYPQPKPRKKLPVRHTHVLILSNENGQILLEKRPAHGIWGGLWSLPQNQDPNALFDELRIFSPKANEEMAHAPPTIRHTFSHFHLDIDPIYANSQNTQNTLSEPNRFRWYCPNGDDQIGLAAPIKKLLESRKFDRQ